MVNSSNFQESIIAQADDQDWSESGWVAVVKDDFAALGHYSHCSCYGTWTSLSGGGISTPGGSTASWTWTGTPSQLLQMAILKEDPGLRGREASPDDCDYGHLMSVYEQIKQHFNYVERL